MKKINYVAIIVLLATFFLASCGENRTVARTAADKTVDLSGRWNDSDSRIVANNVIGDCLSRPWVSDFRDEYGRKPTVIVGKVRNLSSEHIPTQTITKDMERELINSGRVKFVADSNQRNEIRQERQEQQTHASAETAKRLAQETGADFMLKGTINTIIDAYDGQKVKFYQVDLELINVESNEKVWMGGHKIKKLVSSKKVKW
ncbi:MAG: penicillin-binding protein activator LpoB [Candidatus Cloacimonadota bacterium]|nr:MAG: penicillin-binding protein activator LpoB [Candidatus Cloacimonadota bacterium]